MKGSLYPMTKRSEILGVTDSVCEVCGGMVPAKILADEGTVVFKKFCPEHGESMHLVQKDVQHYLDTQRHVKPAWIPRAAAGHSDRPCPQGCGFCERHEQHLCLPIVEITSRCDLTCPICIARAGAHWDMTVTEFDNLLETLIQAEPQIDILNLSGGEPLLHPHLLELIDRALVHPEIVRVSLSTNGLALLGHPALVQGLKQRNVVISLQFDGFNDRAYEILRGRPLRTEKLAILKTLAEADVSTSLTMTLAQNINTNQLQPTIDLLFSEPHLISLMLQPLAFAGRGAALTNRIKRLSIPDVIGLLDQSDNPTVRATDFAPLPCSHPLCFSLAYYLMLDQGEAMSLTRLVDAGQLMDLLANRTVFGLDSDELETLKDLIYDLWSGPAGTAPDSIKVMRTIRRLLDQVAHPAFDPRQVFTTAERHIKSIFIHAFQDADNFDLSRVRRCCQAYPQPDGRLIPVCVHNVLSRNSIEESHHE